MSIQCPRCKLISPLETEKCDCGYHLHLPATMQPTASRQPFHRYSFAQVLGVIVTGTAALVGGCVLCSLSLSQGGGLGLLGLLWPILASAVALAVGLVLLAVGRSQQ